MLLPLFAVRPPRWGKRQHGRRRYTITWSDRRYYCLSVSIISETASRLLTLAARTRFTRVRFLVER